MFDNRAARLACVFAFRRRRRKKPCQTRQRKTTLELGLSTNQRTFLLPFCYLCKTLDSQDISSRKADHIDLAFKAQATVYDNRFDYEPFLAAHPGKGSIPPTPIAGKVMKAPIWVGSMTGGANHAATINRNLAIACREFGLGMGLGSCRPVLEDESYMADFAVRKYIGDQPLFANLGIAQIEQLLAEGKATKVIDLVHRLEADGLIVHINPLQEWLQPEGDKIQVQPLDTLKRLLDVFPLPLMVKEVGQGFGPRSMAELVKLPLEAIEFGAHGGTNFSLLENLRSNPFRREQFEPIANIGHNAVEMTAMVSELIHSQNSDVLCRGFIVSGGIGNFLDGYFLIKQIPWNAIYAQASAFLKYAIQGEEEVLKFTESQIRGLEMAYGYLTPKKQ